MSVFDIFKKEQIAKHVPIKTSAVEDVFFITKSDETGYYISLVDDRGKEISINYRHYNGALRSVVKAVEEIKNRDAFTINWETLIKKFTCTSIRIL